jgi:hypothetical protein
LEQWQQWITEGWFRPLSQYIADWQFEGSDVACGLWRLCEGEPARYWIGRFLPAGTEIPEGYEGIDLAAGTLGVCYVKGKGLELYRQQAECFAALDAAGLPYTGVGENDQDSRKIYYIDLGDGKKLGIVNVTEHEYSYALPNRCGCNPYDPYLTMQDIREAKKNADYV